MGEKNYIKITFERIPPLKQELLPLVNKAISIIKFTVDF